MAVHKSLARGGILRILAMSVRKARLTASSVCCGVRSESSGIS